MKNGFAFLFTVLGVCAALTLAGCGRATQAPAAPAATQTAVQTGGPDSDEAAQRRHKMVDNLVSAGYLKDPRVIEAMRVVPRHAFIPADKAEYAYSDTPLPIGYGQTISAPSIVALMTELLELQAGEKVLEIGAGSGYQAAVLAAAEDVAVYTIEIVPELAGRAGQSLREQGYERVALREADGYYGWPEHAPFDAIIVTAAPDHLPAPLAQQLKEGGRLVIPIGPPGGYQTLWKFVKQGGEMKAYNITGVIFVPFTGEGIQQREGVQTPPP